MSRRQFGRIRQLPSGRWQARYAVDGGELRTAPCTFPTKGDAARYLATIETDLARGQYIDPRLGMVTLWEWAEQWLARPGKRANSVARDRQALEAFLKDLGGRPLASITPMHVQGVVDVRAKLVSPATLARDFSALRAVLNSAVSADIIGRSPARKIALPRPRPPRRVGLRPDELEKLASEVPGRYRALVLMAGILGLRWGEAVDAHPRHRLSPANGNRFSGRRGNGRTYCGRAGSQDRCRTAHPVGSCVPRRRACPTPCRISPNRGW